MLMKWTDLEPGDIIRLNEEFVKSYAKFPDKDVENSWVGDIKDKEIIVEKIIVYPNKKDISIVLYQQPVYSVGVDQNDGTLWKTDIASGIPVFKIVRLKED